MDLRKGCVGEATAVPFFFPPWVKREREEEGLAPFIFTYCQDRFSIFSPFFAPPLFFPFPISLPFALFSRTDSAMSSSSSSGKEKEFRGFYLTLSPRQPPFLPPVENPLFAWKPAACFPPLSLAAIWHADLSRDSQSPFFPRLTLESQVNFIFPPERISLLLHTLH